MWPRNKTPNVSNLHAPTIQEKSYWALRLPAGWWVLGVDLALVDDLDMAQYA